MNIAAVWSVLVIGCLMLDAFTLNVTVCLLEPIRSNSSNISFTHLGNLCSSTWLFGWSSCVQVCLAHQALETDLISFEFEILFMTHQLNYRLSSPPRVALMCYFLGWGSWHFLTQLRWWITRFCITWNGLLPPPPNPALSRLWLPCCWCPSCGLKQFKKTQADRLKKEPCIVVARSTQWAVSLRPVNQLCNMTDGDTKPLPWFCSLVYLQMLSFLDSL